ncbi:MAG: HAMP domain-containing protein [Saprospirales bacterium]|nr:HAMP domain-containing protein [Saprospirales bacterium]
MNLKIKLTIGLSLLFGMLLLVSVLGIFCINTLSTDAAAILKDNYQSLRYVQQMQQDLNSPSPDQTAFETFRHYLDKQEQNITEPGEGEATEALAREFERLKSHPADPAALQRLRHQLLVIFDLNLRAIDRKNALALQTADQTSKVLSIIATFCLLVAFVFLLNFPGYFADPIRQLTEGIKEIAEGNYTQRIHLKRTDEFGELVSAFNDLAAKLDAYEHSNLARIMFEKRRLEIIIGAMHDPVIGLDEHSRVLFANEPALGLLHLSVSQLIGKDAREAALTNDLLRTLLARRSKASLEPLKIFAEGKESFFQLESIDIPVDPTPVQTQPAIGGQVLHLKNITTFLERDVAKTNFFATVSHELKTPISSIKMGLKLLEDPRIGALNDEQRHLVQQLEEDTGRLLNITAELLKLAQAESGNIQLNLTPVSPEEIVKTAGQALAGQLQEKNITLHWPAPLPPGERVLADEDKAVWVLINLLNNAIRHSPEHKSVHVFIEPQSEFTRFVVQDQGPGIPSQYHSKIFERFFRVPGASAGAARGWVWLSAGSSCGPWEEKSGLNRSRAKAAGFGSP